MGAHTFVGEPPKTRDLTLFYFLVFYSFWFSVRGGGHGKMHLVYIQFVVRFIIIHERGQAQDGACGSSLSKSYFYFDSCYSSCCYTSPSLPPSLLPSFLLQSLIKSPTAPPPNTQSPPHAKAPAQYT